MPPLPTAILAFFRRYAPLPSGGTLVVAVSGGPDSLALLHALCGLRGRLAIELHVAHFDHMLRGAESAAEARFVAETAQAWGVQVTVEATNVRALAQEQRANLHAAGRVARYAFFARLADETGAQAVATAHHADDQAETVLDHLLRGAGPAGLAGMRPVTAWENLAEEEKRRRGARLSSSPLLLFSSSPLLVRPLLAVTRAEVEAYCAEHSLEARRDPSNEDRRYRRTRIRQHLLPSLIEYNPRIVEALRHTAAASAAEHDFLEQALDAAWPTIVSERMGAFVFDNRRWGDLHAALRSAAIRRAHAVLANSETLGFEDVARAIDVADGQVGRRAELPGGVTLTADYHGFVMARGEPPAPDGPQLAVIAVDLGVPAMVELGHGWRLYAETGLATQPHGPWEVYLDRRVAEQLRVRRRKPGDRIRLAGGSRRLQDLLVDAHVYRELRAAWPVVASGDEIAWVPGVRAAAGFVAAQGALAVHLVVGRTKP